jgi:peroxiredoxin
MKDRSMLMTRPLTSIGWTLMLALAPMLGQAQSATAPVANPQPLVLQATTLANAPFDLTRLKGKVVMVFYWSTGCSVCLSHLPELRANLGGWRTKPFELLTVNVDANMAQWRTYEQIAAQTQSPLSRPTALWAGKGAAQKLPLTLVLDTQGRVVARHEGRIAPEAWDEVAELLP